jgi:hypothetical protein|nr:MAG TPA: hypothetical protein [Caudoviricetes sp.]
MCILKKAWSFIKNGVSTFRDASQGRYKQNSEAISEIRREILEIRKGDKRNLREDRKNIERDMRRSLYPYIILRHIEKHVSMVKKESPIPRPTHDQPLLKLRWAYGPPTPFEIRLYKWFPFLGE